MGNGTILMAEDNPLGVEMFVPVLKAAGIDNDVVVARDGVEALDYLFGNSDQPDLDGGSVMPHLVLVDLSMPRMGGLEVIRRLRENEPTRLLPVVVLSSSTFPRDVIEAYRAGANSYVDKASDMPWTELVPLIVRYWLPLNVPAHLNLLNEHNRLADGSDR